MVSQGLFIYFFFNFFFLSSYLWQCNLCFAFSCNGSLLFQASFLQVSTNYFICFTCCLLHMYLKLEIDWICVNIKRMEVNGSALSKSFDMYVLYVCLIFQFLNSIVRLENKSENGDEKYGQPVGLGISSKSVRVIRCGKSIQFWNIEFDYLGHLCL